MRRMSIKRVALDDIELTVADAGQGPTLLLVHGFPLDHRMWHEQMAAFSPTCRVLAPDLCGFGQSGRRDGMVGMDQMADDLALLLDALGVVQPVTLCGLSMGGYVAWQFWRRHPQRLARLVLCDTRAAADGEETARGRELTARRLLAEGPPVVVQAMLERLVSPTTRADRPAVVEQLRQMMLEGNAQGMAAALRGMAVRDDALPWLAEVRVPTLAIAGADDVISPPPEMQAFAAQMPAARFVEIAAAGHMAPLEQPAAVNAALAAFLAETQPTA